jgi:hypothetical protein
MSPTLRLTLLSLLIPAAACRTNPGLLRPPEGQRPELARVGLPAPDVRGAYVVDGGGRQVRELQSGSTLHLGAQQLQPA